MYPSHQFPSKRTPFRIDRRKMDICVEVGWTVLFSAILENIFLSTQYWKIMFRCIVTKPSFPLYSPKWFLFLSFSTAVFKILINLRLYRFLRTVHFSPILEKVNWSPIFKDNIRLIFRKRNAFSPSLLLSRAVRCDKILENCAFRFCSINELFCSVSSTSTKSYFPSLDENSVSLYF